MKYVLLFGGTMEGIDQLEGGARGEAMADYEKSGQWFEKYTKAGKVVGGEELQGPSTATTVSRKNGKIVVTDGPFIESKEVIGGFALIEVSDLDEALAMAKEWPGTVEIRPVIDHSQERGGEPGHHPGGRCHGLPRGRRDADRPPGPEPPQPRPPPRGGLG